MQCCLCGHPLNSTRKNHWLRWRRGLKKFEVLDVLDGSGDRHRPLTCWTPPQQPSSTMLSRWEWIMHSCTAKIIPRSDNLCLMNAIFFQPQEWIAMPSLPVSSGLNQDGERRSSSSGSWTSVTDFDRFVLWLIITSKHYLLTDEETWERFASGRSWHWV